MYAQLDLTSTWQLDVCSWLLRDACLFILYTGEPGRWFLVEMRPSTARSVLPVRIVLALCILVLFVLVPLTQCGRHLRGSRWSHDISLQWRMFLLFCRRNCSDVVLSNAVFIKNANIEFYGIHHADLQRHCDFESSMTQSSTPSPSVTLSASSAMTSSATQSSTITQTSSISATQSSTLTTSSSQTQSPSQTQTSSPTLTSSMTSSASCTQSLSQATSPSVTNTVSTTQSGSQTRTASATQSASVTLTASTTQSVSQIQTRSVSQSQTDSLTISPSATASASQTQTSSVAFTPSVTQSVSQTITGTQVLTGTSTMSGSVTRTPSQTASRTASQLQTGSSTMSITASGTLSLLKYSDADDLIRSHRHTHAIPNSKPDALGNVLSQPVHKCCTYAVTIAFSAVFTDKLWNGICWRYCNPNQQRHHHTKPDTVF